MPLHFRAWTTMVGDHGLQFPEVQLFALAGMPSSAIIALLAGEQGREIIAADVLTMVAEKEQHYLQAPSGLPLVQDALQAALECVFEGHFGVTPVVQKFALAPAQLFDVAERGFLREGYFADLVLVDPQSTRLVWRDQVLSKCGWSPFEGMQFRSRIAATFVNGELAWDGQRLIGDPRGQRLEFAR